MKRAAIILLATLIAFASTGLAMAAGSVQVDQTVTVSADVKNATDVDLQAAVKLVAYDIAGTAVGHVCREVSLAANKTTPVSYQWRAPSYETGLYWSSTVTIDGVCANHDGDDTDSDSDSDGDDEDSDSDD